MTTPYTYLIGWSGAGLFYYGVRYAPGCHPDDLWTKYFTSSLRVEAFRKTNGEPDVIQVRRRFTDGLAARKWEERVLAKLDAVASPKWMNLANWGHSFCNVGPETAESIRRSKIGKKRGPHTQAAKDKIAAGNRGKIISIEQRSKLSMVRMGVIPANKGKPSPLRGVLRSSDTKEKISASLKGRVFTPEHRANISKARINRPSKYTEEFK